MIISRTPFSRVILRRRHRLSGLVSRISRAVLASTIDKFAISRPAIFRRSSSTARLILFPRWSTSPTSMRSITLPCARHLRFLNIHEGVEIHHDGDLPARSGLGSSSSFTVGLLTRCTP